MSRRDPLAWLDLDQLANTRPAPGWEKAGACHGTDPAAFYPEGTKDLGALTYCERCPVRLECLAAGLADDHGIWGGTNGRQRRRIRPALRTQRAAA